ncbi:MULTISPECIES: amino acid adenylation domain-containing protein [Streptomycetaceae]|uniref:amino acid adenylation domain-containing protein n=1 Tax=Streptomycetaceae TaxID=2062 RepID=UPI001E6512BE|nr:amino acid adenylation domain-containing protein [Streptantibioticus cattleyicolor]
MERATGREFWQRALAGGGLGPLPRWSAAEPVTAGAVGRPDPGARETARYRAEVPRPVVDGLLRLGAELDLPQPVLLLAAWVKVLAVLTGDPAVVTAHADRRDGGCPVPCPVVAADGTWRALLEATATRLAEASAAGLDELDEVCRAAGRATPYDTVLVADGEPDARDLAGDVVLALGTAVADGRTELVLCHRPDALDAGQTGRIAGYLLNALQALAATPHADHHDWSPVSAEETAYQLHGLAGRQRPLPKARFHQLFEEQTRLRPDEVAAVHRGATLTYRQLNERANRIAHQLRSGGLRDEDVVAVVTERDLDWLAAVVAVFKAGGVYLPVEPHFPADRVADMLGRSGCRRVLTTRGACPALDDALAGLPGVRPEHLDELLAADAPVTDPGLPVAPGQGAYIYFTSGSTGRPKGAMCEHAGFLNHLFAKIDDLGITEGTVVAQTAPQCFDISLWQLVAALVTGGRTVIVEQEAVLDAARFIALLAAERVEVAQVVPSYLDVVLAELERTRRELPHLRCVSATGEALKKELVERWFAAFPDGALANAYGLTETCDDTNHEVMRAVPEQPSVPLGRPVSNVRVYVVDERLRMVPLGSPGEIVMSGVCVGRGYVNDPERTDAAFLADPYLPGERLYRSGDFGRWLPDGRLEYLGRRDAQVKIHGFRIEIGEVENRLLRVAGVRDSAVVVTGDDDGKQLEGFYCGPAEVPEETLRAELSAALPSYMVPSRFHHLPALPLTANGKTDRKALTRLASEAADGERAADAPATATERHLAALWSEVLKVPVDRIGRAARFGDLGGTSLTLLRLAVRLDGRATPAELRGTADLADLAALLDRKALTEAAV